MAMHNPSNIPVCSLPVKNEIRIGFYQIFFFFFFLREGQTAPMAWMQQLLKARWLSLSVIICSRCSSVVTLISSWWKIWKKHCKSSNQKIYNNLTAWTIQRRMQNLIQREPKKLQLPKDSVIKYFYGSQLSEPPILKLLSYINNGVV